MTIGTEAIAAIGPDGGSPLISHLGQSEVAQAAQAPDTNFGTILTDSLEAVDSKIASANNLVRQFAVDDSIPVHQVTLALEEARLAVELAMQVRARLVETYREFMNMQL